MLQIIAFGLRAFERLIQAGTGEIIARVGLSHFQNTVGVFQRGYEIVVDLMQMAQIARQTLQHSLWGCGAKVVGFERHVWPKLAQ